MTNSSSSFIDNDPTEDLYNSPDLESNLNPNSTNWMIFPESASAVRGSMMNSNDGIKKPKTYIAGRRGCLWGCADMVVQPPLDTIITAVLSGLSREKVFLIDKRGCSLVVMTEGK